MNNVLLENIDHNPQFIHPAKLTNPAPPTNVMEQLHSTKEPLNAAT